MQREGLDVFPTMIEVPLFDLADFEETTPPPVVVAEWVHMLPCGVHRLHDTADAEAHGAECWGGECPACGDEIRGVFDVLTNHIGAESGFCTSMHLRLNHLCYAIRTGETPSERDVSVFELGWRISPDGSAIAPEGTDLRIRRMLAHPRTREDWARWVGMKFRRAA